MSYNATVFESDMNLIGEKNNPKNALNRLKRINKKVKEAIEFHGFEAGKPYTKMQGPGNKLLVAHYPVVVGDTDNDEIWDKVDGDLSIDVGDLLDNFNLEDAWGWEGIEVSKKSPKDTIDLLFYLK